ncbi:MAG: lytic transglycosylase domain-containing protein [Acidithiobacillus ferrooxidans]|nr:lytic transglycosylase domain-containing protein [Acidithiobacillus ferrooxidans]MDD5002836.1 lytic transglycosylase domain-containing protein [Acidithiobacillus sp.]MDD5379718.1 lytic transglycosylase domain-containing protein [Acidithiobacillus sp.]MDD5576185.1 lytic transglycosylase domain-containing protein [Acidithiobacillus sp.]
MIPLSQISAECAPMVAPSTMAAIVQVESGGRPLAMWNNSTRSMVIPGSRAQAIQYLRHAMAAGQRVDVGLAQVDTGNFTAFNLTPRTAFNACANLRAGSEILRMDWQQALASGYRGQQALYHAFEAYNSGRLRGDAQYANRILGAAGVPAPAGCKSAGCKPADHDGLRTVSQVNKSLPTNPFPQFRWQALPAQAVTLAPAGDSRSWPVLP